MIKFIKRKLRERKEKAKQRKKKRNEMLKSVEILAASLHAFHHDPKFTMWECKEKSCVDAQKILK